jgi:small-conductance mechanosensitive channel
VQPLFQRLPWLEPALWTTLTVGGAYLLGHLINLIVAGRLSHWARATQGQWDDIVVKALTSRIPLWSVLAGAWLSLGYWTITDRWLQLASVTIQSLAILSVTLAVAQVAASLVLAYGSTALPGGAVSGLTQNVVRLLIVTFGLLVVLNGLGVEIRPMLAALGVGGLAVALALQEPLSNLFAGLFVTMAGQIRIGDWVRLDSGLEGRVVDFDWRSTSLEVGTGIAVVPNAKLAQATVTNHNLPTPEVNVPVDFVVDYASDAQVVEAEALRVAREVQASVEGAVSTFEPNMRFAGFGDQGLRATVLLRARTHPDQALLKHAFVTRLHAAFVARGIEIPTTIPRGGAPPQITKAPPR